MDIIYYLPNESFTSKCKYGSLIITWPRNGFKVKAKVITDFDNYLAYYNHFHPVQTTECMCLVTVLKLTHFPKPIFCA